MVPVSLKLELGYPRGASTVYKKPWNGWKRSIIVRNKMLKGSLISEKKQKHRDQLCIDVMSFCIQNGTRQGAVWLTYLFSRYIRDLLRRVVDCRVGCNVGGCSLMVYVLACWWHRYVGSFLEGINTTLVRYTGLISYRYWYDMQYSKNRFLALNVAQRLFHYSFHNLLLKINNWSSLQSSSILVN